MAGFFLLPLTLTTGRVVVMRLTAADRSSISPTPAAVLHDSSAANSSDALTDQNKQQLENLSSDPSCRKTGNMRIPHPNTERKGKGKEKEKGEKQR